MIKNTIILLTLLGLNPIAFADTAPTVNLSMAKDTQLSGVDFTVYNHNQVSIIPGASPISQALPLAITFDFMMPEHDDKAPYTQGYTIDVTVKSADTLEIAMPSLDTLPPQLCIAATEQDGHKIVAHLGTPVVISQAISAVIIENCPE